MTLVTAASVAAELRKMANALDTKPELLMRRPSLGWHYYSHDGGKDAFLGTARILPRPVEKSLSTDYGSGQDLQVSYSSDSLYVLVSIPQNALCKLVTPARAAVYDCAPILSQEEEASLAEA